MTLARKLGFGVLLGACLDPTEITVVLQTNFSCADFAGARLRVGAFSTDAIGCTPSTSGDATIGTLVVLPGSSLDTPVAITVTGAVREGGQPAPTLDACEASGTNGAGCLTTSRSLHLILHRSLTLPILIDSRCAHTSCGAGTTCIEGACVPIACEAAQSNVVTCATDAGGPDATPPSISVVDIAARDDATCVVFAAGDVKCWGTNTGNRFGQNVTGLKKLVLGEAFGCGLTQAGGIVCWGDDSEGQLGDGTTQSRATPKPIASALTFSVVAAGTTHACAVTLFPDARAFCWGSNISTDLAQPATTAFVLTPTLVPGGLTVFDVCAGESHTCALGNSNAQPTTDFVYCWGTNFSAFGNSAGSTATPTVVPNVSLPDMIACGDNFTVATESLASGIAAWGDNTFGQTNPAKLGNSPLPPALVIQPYMLPVVAGKAIACGVDNSDGSVTCWGNGAGPAKILLPARATRIAAGGTHACAVISGSGTDEVWCWDAGVAPARVLP